MLHDCGRLCAGVRRKAIRRALVTMLQANVKSVEIVASLTELLAAERALAQTMASSQAAAGTIEELSNTGLDAPSLPGDINTDSRQQSPAVAEQLTPAPSKAQSDLSAPQTGTKLESPAHSTADTNPGSDSRRDHQDTNTCSPKDGNAAEQGSSDTANTSPPQSATAVERSPRSAAVAASQPLSTASRTAKPPRAAVSPMATSQSAAAQLIPTPEDTPMAIVPAVPAPPAAKETSENVPTTPQATPRPTHMPAEAPSSPGLLVEARVLAEQVLPFPAFPLKHMCQVAL